MSEPKASIVRNHLGSLAIAFAVIFAAGVFGFIESKPFAIFFLSFIGFLVLAGVGCLFAQVAQELGWLGAIPSVLCFLMALAALIGGIQAALDEIRSPTAAAAVLPHD